MSEFPNNPSLHINIKGSDIIKKGTTSALSARRNKKALFDPSTIEENAIQYNMDPVKEGEPQAILSARSPSLLAIKNKITNRAKTTMTTTRGDHREVEIYTPRRAPSMLTKESPRPKTTLQDRTLAFTRKISRDNETEKIALNFEDDPIAYFSKRKDGRGHRFIYLIHADDKADPYFNPYKLIKVPYAEIKPEYFTMSAQGVTHLYPDGTTECVPIDKWATETSIYESAKKLKFFAQYFFWKPFKNWKNFVRRQRFLDTKNNIVSHKYFSYPGFFATKMSIINLYIDEKLKLTVPELVEKYIFSFNPQQRYELTAFTQATVKNIASFEIAYKEYIENVEHLMLILDSKIRDPKVVQVKDTDFPEIKLRNPNLKKLKLLEERKAKRRIELTNMVNSQIIQFGYFIRDVDNMLIETLATAAKESWEHTKQNVLQPLSSIFNIEVSFGEKGQVILTPSLDDLISEIKHSFLQAKTCLDGLPRIIDRPCFKPHLRESHPNFEAMMEEKPSLIKYMDRYTSIIDAEDTIVNAVSNSYKESVKTSVEFEQFFNLYKLGQSWTIDKYISSRSGKPAAWKPGDGKSKDVQAENIDFDTEPIIDIKSIRELLISLQASEKSLADFTPHTLRDMIYIDSKQLRNFLNPIPTSLQNRIKDSLNELLLTKTVRAKIAINFYTTQLKNKPQTLTHFVKFCEVLTKTAIIIKKLQQESDFIDNLIIPVNELNKVSHATELAQNSIPPLISAFVQTNKEANETKISLQEFYINELKKLCDTIDMKIGKAREKVANTPKNLSDVRVEQQRESIMLIKEEVMGLYPDVNEALHFQDVLQQKFSDFKSLTQLVEYIDMILRMYDIIGAWKAMEKNVFHSPFELLRAEEFKQDLSSINDQTKDLTSKMSLMPGILIELEHEISKVFPYVDEIVLLATSNMMPRHWEQLFQSAGSQVPYRTDIHLYEIIQSGVLSNRRHIKQVTDIASNEKNIEDTFKAIEAKWSQVYLPTANGTAKGEDVLLIADTTEIVSDLEKTVKKLSEINNLQFATGVREQVVKMISTLQNAALVLEEWQKFQMNWVLLSTLLNTEEGKTTLVSQVSKFSQVRRRWVSIVKHSYKDLTLLSVCSYPALLESMRENREMLESIIETLGKFIDSKRQSSPRLFALGNSDILSLLAFADVPNLQRFIPRLFMNVKALDINDDPNMSITMRRIKVAGFIGPSGDVFSLDKPVTITGPIETWLKQLIDVSHESLAKSIKSILFKSATMQITDWILNVPVYVAYIVFCVEFTREVEECFNAYESNIRSFSTYESRLKNRYNSLITLLDTPITSKEAHKISTLLTIIMNHIDIIHQFTDGLQSKWIWQIIPKLNFIESSNKCTISYEDKVENFGFEIWGDLRPFILTPQIQKMGLSMLQSKFPTIVGSPGTGKRSLIKYMAAHFGRYVHSMPALFSLNAERFMLTIKYIAISGSWIIFNEINKLAQKPLSSLCDMICVFQDGSENGKFTINDEEFAFVPSSKIFFTSTEPISKASTIPPQLKAILKSIALSTPEKKILIEMQLAAAGFKSSKTTSLKINSTVTSIVDTFCSVLKSNSMLSHIFSIVNRMKKYIRDTKFPQFKCPYTQTQEIEEFIAARAIYNHFSTLINGYQLESLVKIIFITFPLSENVELMKSRLESNYYFNSDNIYDLIGTQLIAITSQYSNGQYLAQQALNLFTMLQKHRVIIIHGEPGSGKSKIVEILKDAIDQTIAIYADKPKPPKITPLYMTRIYYKAKEMKCIFGEWTRKEQDNVTVWSNGQADVLLESIASIPKKLHKIMIFDGPLDKDFLTTITTVSAQEQSCVTSMNIVNFKLKGKLTFIIETDTVKDMLPSQIPMCGFLHMRGIQDNWLETAEIRDCPAIISRVFPANLSPSIYSIFEDILPPTVKYIYHTPNLLCNYEEYRKISGSNSVLSDFLTTAAVKLFDSLIQTGAITLDDDENIRKGAVSATFHAFQGILDEKQAIQFDLWMRSSFKIADIPEYNNDIHPSCFCDSFPNGSLMTHVLKQNKFELISTEPMNAMVLEREDIIPTTLRELTVCSPEILVSSYTLELALKRKIPTIIVGGSGKDTFINHFFKTRKEYIAVHIHVSPLYSIDSIIGLIDLCTDLTKKFSDCQQSFILVFHNIDNACHELLEFIRMIISTKTLLRTSQSNIKGYDNVKLRKFNVVCTTSKYSDLPARFLSRMLPIRLNTMSIASTKFVAQRLLKALSVESSLAESLTDVLEQSMLQIPEFPRDISNIIYFIDGISQTKDKLGKDDKMKMDAVRIFISDIRTFFFNQYVGQWETFVQIFNHNFKMSTLIEECKDENSLFVVNLQKQKGENPTITGSFESFKNITEELTLYLQVYNKAPVEKLDIRFFTSLLRCWSSFRRTLQFPISSIILKGKEGSGRLTLSRFLANMLQYDFVNIADDPYNPITIEYLTTLLSDICMNCSLMDKKCVLFIRHKGNEISNILRLILDFIQGFCFPLILSKSHQEDIFVKFTGRTLTKPEQYVLAYNKLCTVLAESFHVIIAMNDDSCTLPVKLPVIDFNCTGHKDLEEIAKDAVSNETMQNVFGIHARTLPRILTELHEHAVEIINYDHRNKFYDFLDTFCKLANQDYINLVDRSRNLLTTLNFFNDLKDQSVQTLRDYERVNPGLQRVADDVDALTVSYNSKMQGITQRRKEIEAEESDYLKSIHGVESAINKLNKEQSELLPVLLAQRDAVKNLTDNDIKTLRLNLIEPLPSLKLLLEVLCGFMDLPISFEPHGRDLLNDNRFVTNITSRIDHQKLDRAIIEHVEPYFMRQDFSEKVMDNAAPSMKTIYVWLKSIIQYSNNSEQLTAMRVKLSDLQVEYDEKKKLNAEENERMSSMETQLEEEKAALRSSLQSKEALEIRFENIKNRQEAINAILSDVDEFLMKWAHESNEITTQRELIIGTALLMSYYVNYASMVNEKLRKKLISVVVDEIKECGLVLPHEKPKTTIRDKLLFDSTSENEMFNPAENIIFDASFDVYMTKFVMRVPLIMDVDGFALLYFTKMYRTRNFNVVSVHNENLERDVCVAIKEGSLLVVTDYDMMHPIINQLLTTIRIGFDNIASKNIKINQKSIQYNKSFRLILISNFRNISEIPDQIMTRVSPIDMSDSSIKACNTMIFNEIINGFIPDILPAVLTDRRNKIEKSVNYKLKERDTILTVVDAVNKQTADDQYDFLEDKSFIADIVRSKNQLFEAYNILLDETTAISKQRVQPDVFKGVAKNLTFVWESLSNYAVLINRNYKFSFTNFLQVVGKSLNLPGFGQINLKPDQAEQLSSTLMQQVILSICPSVSYRDMLSILFVISFLKQKNQGLVKKKDFNAIIDHISDQKDGIFDYKNNELALGEPFDHLKFTNVSNVFSFVQKAITLTFGQNYTQFMKPFEVDNVISLSCSVPTVILYNKTSPFSIIRSYITNRTRGDNFITISMTGDQHSSQNAKHILEQAMKKGSRVFINISSSDESIYEVLSSATTTLLNTSIHTNFRLIVCSCENIESLPVSLLVNSIRLFYNDSVSIREPTIHTFGNLQNVIRTSQNSIPAKKVAYGSSLLSSILRYRKFMEPVGLDIGVEIPFEELVSSICRVVTMLDTFPQKDTPIRAVRDYMQDVVLGCSSLDVFDRRKIRALVYTVFSSDFMKEGYSFVPDFADKDKYDIPHGATLPNYSAAAAKIPYFPTTDPLVVNTNGWSHIRNWSFSRWVISGLEHFKKMKNAIPKTMQSNEYIIRLKSYMVSIPERIGTGSLSKFVNPTGVFIRGEIDELNMIVDNLRCTFTESPFCEDVSSFIHGKVPENWRRMAKFDSTSSSQHFISHLSERREFLMSYLQDQKIGFVDVKLISNIRGLLQSFMTEQVEHRNLSTDNVGLEFNPIDTSVTQCPPNSIVLTGIHIVQGRFSRESMKVYIDRDTYLCDNFMNICVSVGKPTAEKVFMCPLVRTLFIEGISRNSSLTYTDGCPDNLIWYIPLQSDVQQQIPVTNSTCLVCVIPEQMQ